MKRYLLFFILYFFSYLQSANIIFDLGDVLVQKNSLWAAWEIGLTRFIGIYNPFKTKKILFKFFHSLEPLGEGTPHAYHNSILLPQIMCDYLTGKKSSHQILDLIEDSLDKYPDLFQNSRQKKLIRSISRTIFTPKRLAKIITPVKKGVNLLKKLHQQEDATGNRKHKIYILSNWDPESFFYLHNSKKLKKLFSYCDDIFISGYMGIMKPDPRAFEYLFEKCYINPDHELTVYIDDQRTNIKAAQGLNKKKLLCLHCKKKKFANIKKSLKTLSIL